MITRSILAGRYGRGVRVPISEPVAVFAGGCLGTIARAGLVEWAPGDPGGWPWATFAANLIGAFAIGWVAATLHRGRRRTFLATGVCGALTTFSTFQLELYDLLDRGRVGVAVAYAAASLALGLALVLLARRLAARR
jgi:CrcB protein